MPRQGGERLCSRRRQPSAPLPETWEPHFSTATWEGEAVIEPCTPTLGAGKMEAREVCLDLQADRPKGPQECPERVVNMFACPGCQ